MKTPTKQIPSDCKYYRKRNFFEWLMNDFPPCMCPNKESGMCIWKSNSRVDCPDYQPKDKRDEQERDKG